MSSAARKAGAQGEEKRQTGASNGWSLIYHPVRHLRLSRRRIETSQMPAAHPETATPQATEAAPRRMVGGGFALVLGIAFTVAMTSVADPLEQAVLDSMHRLLAARFPKAPAHEIVVVGIDEESFHAFPEPLALWHVHFGKFLRAMALAGPDIVGVDVVLPTRSYDDLVPGLDGALMQGLLAARGGTRLVLGQTMDERGAPRPIHAPFAAVVPDSAPGYVLLPEDSDGVIRRFSEQLGQDGSAVPTLPGQMARLMGFKPTDGWIDYSFGAHKTYIPLQQVVQWFDAHETAKLKAAFAGQTVLLGGVTLFDDRKPQPVNLVGWAQDEGGKAPGVLIHAQVLKSMINGGLIQPAPRPCLIALILLASLFWFVTLPASGAVALVACLGAALYGASAWFLWHGAYLPVAAAMLIATIAIAARWVFESLRQIRERRMLRSVFAGYVSPQLMQEIIAGRLTDDLAGSLRTVCVMFADVHGFTTMCESTPPQDVLRLLNRYFERVTHAIHAEGGTLNSIMGDGAMAIFGAPISLENPCVPAFAAARRILAMLPALNAELEAEGKGALSIGIGLNVGEAVVGHVGSKTRHDYSAVGDTTNAASRLEGLTTEVGMPLVCSQAVFEALGMPQGFVALGERKIRGRAPMVLFGWRAPM